MGGVFGRWADAARSVGAALLEVLAAELTELQSDLARSGRELRGGLILLGVAAAVAFWTVGLALWVAVELLTLRLPAYGAALVVFAVGVLVSVLLGGLARRRFRRVETPLDAVRRRGQAHAEWWQQAVLPGLGGEAPGRKGDEDDSENLDA